MTLLEHPTEAEDQSSPHGTGRRDWKAPLVLASFAALASVLFIGFGPSGDSTFSFASQHDVISIPAATLPTSVITMTSALATIGIAVVSVRRVRSGQRVPSWFLAVFSLILVIGFLAWSANGHTLPVTGLLAGSLALSVPMVFGALGGVISERSGVVNIAIEGQLLSGAFVSAVVSSMTGSTVVSLVAAAAAGTLVAAVLAVFSIKYYVNQVIVGVVVNVLVLGLTGFLYSTTLTRYADFANSPEQLPTITIPGLSAIPVLGPVLFNQTIVVYLIYIAVPAVFYGLYYTRWGLRLRAVGEHPKAADTVGIRVNRIRFGNVALAGAIVGIGGAYFTIGSVGGFTKNVTSGAGYIALAAVIFGGWNPIRAALAALLFGFASNLQSELGILGSSAPSEFLLMFPYVITIAAVAGLSRHTRQPAANGEPYISGGGS
ncbi:ABC transporter permease [Streptomyces acidicola]|uniref:ABC transporter permease n=1 Tax=Streptomyces acidicola TaxID=2596892 RepID=UPI0034416822